MIGAIAFLGGFLCGVGFLTLLAIATDDEVAS